MNKTLNLKKLSRIIAIVIVIIFIFSLISKMFQSEEIYSADAYLNNQNITYDDNTSYDDVSYETTSGIRNKFTKIIGDGEDDVTVMVYMIGSDLESDYGAATADINEMLYSEIEGNINIVLQTGGANRWQNTTVSNRKIERYTINADGFYKLNCKVNNEPMTSVDSLCSFIKYSADNFRANRYMLVLWDHGGGSVTGYGLDENYPNSRPLSPDNIAKAIKNSGVKFDFVGFDACLMGNFETAIALEPYADYLIASEETEPGEGWFYTNWIKELDNNPSIKTVDLGKKIIDDYINISLKNNRNNELTLSLVDLGELAYNTKTPITIFSKATKEKIDNNEYDTIAHARGNSKEFSKGSYIDQIDMIDFVNKVNVNGSDELVNALKKAIKYNKTANILNSYGLSIYFPYASLTKVNEMMDIYDNINMDKEYVSTVRYFASFAGSGQVYTNNYGSFNSSLFDILTGNSYQGSEPDIDIYSYDNYNNVYGNGYDEWFEDATIDLISISLEIKSQSQI